MKRLKATLDVIATLFVLIAAGTVIWYQISPRSSVRSRARVEDVTGTLPAQVAAFTRGSGQLVLVEFADFECPFCGQHARDVEPVIRKKFVDTGVLRQVFVNLPLQIHSHALAASEAAVCASRQKKFWEMYDALFSNQKELEEKDLIRLAGSIGLDAETFASCLTNGEARTTVRSQQDAAKAMQVQSTPAFFLGVSQPDGSILFKKRLNGALPFDDFESAIASLVGSKSALLSEVASNFQ